MSSRTGFLSLRLLRRDDRLQILTLSSLVCPVPVCGTGRLLGLVDGFLNLAVHRKLSCVRLFRWWVDGGIGTDEWYEELSKWPRRPNPQLPARDTGKRELVGRERRLSGRASRGRERRN